MTYFAYQIPFSDGTVYFLTDGKRNSFVTKDESSLLDKIVETESEGLKVKRAVPASAYSTQVVDISHQGNTLLPEPYHNKD